MGLEYFHKTLLKSFIQKFKYVNLSPKPKSLDAKKAEKISKALADPTRLMILKEVKRKKDCLYCSELNDMLDLAQPSIYHHLKQLLDTELISSDKEGRNVRYYLNSAVLDDYINFLEGFKR